MPAPLAVVLPVRFNEAIRAADRRSVQLPDVYYGELQATARSRAFTISGLASVIQIREALDSLNVGLHDGMTFSAWKALAAEKEWGLPAARLDLILRAHTQTAYNAGAWEQFDRLAESRGYLMYSAINDSRTRPTHRAMDGVIKPLGDAFWETHSPPCGYNCRCGLISLTKDEATARGGVTQQLSPDARADRGWGAKPQHGGIDMGSEVSREALNLPTPLQSAIQQWYDGVKADRIREDTVNFFDDFHDVADDLDPFLRDMQGTVVDYEAVALRHYTNDYSGPMNRFLRGYEAPSNGVVSATLAATQGLAKMPTYAGTVYRGFDLEGLGIRQGAFLAAHRVGEVVEYQAFTSGSYTSSFSGDVQLIIISRGGRDVTSLSAHPEDEVIFLPSTKFRVLESEVRDGILHIKLEELDDQGVSVPADHRFAASDALQQRVAGEMHQVDPAIMERFKAAHGGMTPLEWAISLHPSVRLDFEEHAPHLLPK